MQNLTKDDLRVAILSAFNQTMTISELLLSNEIEPFRQIYSDRTMKQVVYELVGAGLLFRAGKTSDVRYRTTDTGAGVISSHNRQPS